MLGKFHGSPYNLLAQIRAMTVVGAFLLAACSASDDLQGRDPRDYYVQHPIENQVETKQLAQTIMFAPNSTRIAAAELTQISEAMGDHSPLSVHAIAVTFAKGESAGLQQRRALALKKQLRQAGYSQVLQVDAPSYQVERDMAELVFTYSIAVSPHCPDWRASPVTSNSNSNTANHGCAMTVNLGKMVADPQDLVRGSGNIRPDAERNHAAMMQYYGVAAATSGAATAEAGAAPAAAPSSGASAGAASPSAIPQ